MVTKRPKSKNSWGKPLIKSWRRMQRMMKEYFTIGGLPTVVVREISELQAKKLQC